MFEAIHTLPFSFATDTPLLKNTFPSKPTAQTPACPALTWCIVPSTGIILLSLPNIYKECFPFIPHTDGVSPESICVSRIGNSIHPGGNGPRQQSTFGGQHSVGSLSWQHSPCWLLQHSAAGLSWQHDPTTGPGGLRSGWQQPIRGSIFTINTYLTSPFNTA